MGAHRTNRGPWWRSLDPGKMSKLSFCSSILPASLSPNFLFMSFKIFSLSASKSTPRDHHQPNGNEGRKLTENKERGRAGRKGICVLRKKRVHDDHRESTKVRKWRRKGKEANEAKRRHDHVIRVQCLGVHGVGANPFLRLFLHTYT